MSIVLYMDVHVPRAITVGLRLRGVDVMTAQEDGSSRLPDPELLDRASELGRVLFSRDDDLLREARRRQTVGISFAGVIYCHQRWLGIGRCIDGLEIIAKVAEPADLENRVEYLTG